MSDEDQRFVVAVAAHRLPESREMLLDLNAERCSVTLETSLVTREVAGALPKSCSEKPYTRNDERTGSFQISKSVRHLYTDLPSAPDLLLVWCKWCRCWLERYCLVWCRICRSGKSFAVSKSSQPPNKKALISFTILTKGKKGHRPNTASVFFCRYINASDRSQPV